MAAFDPISAMLDASRTGLAIGQAISADSARLQQLQSQRAMQRIEEQQIAQTMALQMAEYDRVTQQRADLQKAMARVAIDTAPTVPMGFSGPTPDGTPLGVQQVPNPAQMHLEDALGKHVLPLLDANQQLGALSEIAAMKRARQQGVENQFQPRVIQVPTGRGDETMPFGFTSQNAGQFLGGNDLKIERDPTTGESFYRNRFGDPVRIPRNQQAFRAAMAEHALAKDASDLSEENPDFPGLRRISDANFPAFQKRMSVQAGTRGEMEAALLSADTTIAGAEDAIRIIRETPEALGLIGMGREGWETLKGLAGSTTKPNVAIARDALTQAFTRLSEDLKIDSGNLSLYERHKLEDAGDPTKWNQFPARTEPKMQALIDAALAKKIRLLTNMGKPITDDVLIRIPVSEVQGLVDSDLIGEPELVNLVRKGRLTAKQALEINERKPKG